MSRVCVVALPSKLFRHSKSWSFMYVMVIWVLGKCCAWFACLCALV